VPLQRMRGCILLTDSNLPLNLFIVILRQSELHNFHAVILENFPSVSTVISPLRPRGNFMYRKFYTLTKCKYCITACLCVSYDYQSKDN
jgi:hypothetical protein